MIKRYLIIIACVCACALAYAQVDTIANAATAEAVDTAVATAEATTEETAIISEDEEADKSIVERVTDWYSAHMNYASITALMTVESSFIPFPSEVVVPPAAYVADDPNSPLHATDSYPLNVCIIVLFASLGAMLGAIINYLLSLWLGRPIIYKFADSKLGHLCLLSGEKLQKAEDYFNEHGKVSTFIGRMVPGIRQLISIPAGLAKMHFGAFLGYTFLGAFLWNAILALLGYLLQGQSELITRYSHEIGYVILAIVCLAIVYIVLRKFVFKKKTA